ncbi:MAG: hypothetical protein AB1817_13625 [Chloroflexota bacterium]
MTWQTWIKIETDGATDEAVQQLYDSTRDRQTGVPPDTVRLTSQTPAVARLLYDLNRVIHREAKGLSAREQEIVALIVSAYNG